MCSATLGQCPLFSFFIHKIMTSSKLGRIQFGFVISEQESSCMKTVLAILHENILPSECVQSAMWISLSSLLSEETTTVNWDLILWHPLFLFWPFFYGSLRVPFPSLLPHTMAEIS
ncbi:Uncharacterized protein TCM_006162 [Theobroma cacao]|uniref:Uncharacterized protein n=1 Tax=Theobroma cacao TaxID=3641 RepID=A0A061DXA6_THECC|nr:Uncharacterized protein TCM_006162 [Theobroma cacao]